MNKMMKYRTRQMLFIAGAFGAYFLLWKRVAPKPVLNSVVYHQTLKYLNMNQTTKRVLGENPMIMNCKGSIWPLKSDVNFEITVFGEEKAKFKVDSTLSDNTWDVKRIDMITEDRAVNILKV